MLLLAPLQTLLFDFLIKVGTRYNRAPENWKTGKLEKRGRGDRIEHQRTGKLDKRGGGESENYIVVLSK
jgi:hypothetical protein